MMKYKEYSEIKRLIDIYFDLKKGSNYDEFIRKLAEILRVQGEETNLPPYLIFPNPQKKPSNQQVRF